MFVFVVLMKGARVAVISFPLAVAVLVRAPRFFLITKRKKNDCFCSSFKNKIKLNLLLFAERKVKEKKKIVDKFFNRIKLKKNYATYRTGCLEINFPDHVNRK